MSSAPTTSTSPPAPPLYVVVFPEEREQNKDGKEVYELTANTEEVIKEEHEVQSHAVSSPSSVEPQPSSSPRACDFDNDSDSDVEVQFLYELKATSQQECDFCLGPLRCKRVKMFNCHHAFCRSCASVTLKRKDNRCLICRSGFRGLEVKHEQSTSSSHPKSPNSPSLTSNSVKVPSSSSLDQGPSGLIETNVMNHVGENDGNGENKDMDVEMESQKVDNEADVEIVPSSPREEEEDDDTEWLPPSRISSSGVNVNNVSNYNLRRKRSRNDDNESSSQLTQLQQRDSETKNETVPSSAISTQPSNLGAAVMIPQLTPPTRIRRNAALKAKDYILACVYSSKKTRRGNICLLCDEKFKTRGEVRRHYVARHHMELEKWECRACKKRFDERTGLYSHRRKVHKNLPQQNGR